MPSPTRVRSALPAALALALTAATAGHASGRAATAAPVVWSPVRVHVHVDTTSDWTVLQLSQQIAARADRTTTGVLLSDLADGWSLRGPGAFDADVVLVAGVGGLQVALHKGSLGTAQVRVSTARGRTLLALADDVHGARSNDASTQLSRRALAPAVVTALPHRDRRRLVLAFAYPWFARYDDSQLYEQPAQPRSWASDAGVLSMTRQARAAGIDGFVLSFNGAPPAQAALDRALAAARQTRSVVTPYLETAVAAQQASGPRRAQLVETWLSSALRRAGNPAFLKLGGVPVVMVYDMSLLTPGQWSSVLGQLRAGGQDVRLVGDADPSRYGGVLAGVDDYGATQSVQALAGRVQRASATLRAPAVLDPSAVPPLVLGTVSPGFDDHRLRHGQDPVVARDRGRRYLATWDAALSGSPDWVLVTSWNEWFEGTDVEPGSTTGDLALRETAQRAAAWRRMR